jgi:hypothetical protein
MCPCSFRVRRLAGWQSARATFCHLTTLNALTTNDPNERGTPLWSSCLQGPHALPPPQDTKVRLAPALPTSELAVLLLRLPTHNPNTLFLRQWFVLLTFLVMLSLALLGLTNLAHALPLNDKLLHFFCLGIATGVFYFIFDVEE